jgi:hypothetical protein
MSLFIGWGLIYSQPDGVELTDLGNWPLVFTRTIKENARRLPDTFTTDATTAARKNLLFIPFDDTLNAYAAQAYGNKDSQQENCDWH